jgi:hypothetical protein
MKSIKTVHKLVLLFIAVGIMVWLSAYMHVLSGKASNPLLQLCPDPYEPNENYAGAWNLTSGIIQSYICDQFDLDYFKFSVEAGDTITLDLYDLPQNFDICLYAPDTYPIECSMNNGTADEHISSVSAVSGIFFARVYGAQGVSDGDDPYTLGLHIVDPDCPDLYEPNERFASAWPASDGEYHAYICDDYDQDWLSIELALEQDIEITLTDLPQNYDLELYDPVGRLVASSHNSGLTAEYIQFAATQREGIYAARVFGIGGASDDTNDYKLMLNPGPEPSPTPTPTPVTPTPEPTCAADGYEPNESYAAAALIDTGVEINAYLCPSLDFDYFRFPVSVADEITLQLYDLPKSYQLALYDPGGSLVSQAGGLGRDDRVIAHIAAMSGDYVAKVTRGSPLDWDHDDPYALRVDLVEHPPVLLLPAADTYIYGQESSTNFGDERTLFVGQDEFEYDWRTLIHFDLADVPDTPIASATLKMFLDHSHAHETPEIAVRRLNAAWDESTVTWDTAPTSLGTGVSTPVSSLDYHTFEWDVTDLVQGWLDNPSTNYGMELRLLEPGQYIRIFRSAEYGAGLVAWGGGGLNCPRLVIHYAEAAPGELGSISGSVYEDLNRNGARDPGEGGLNEVRLELFQDGVTFADQTTGVSGGYTFAGLPAGGYEVVIDPWSFSDTYEVIGPDSRDVPLAAGEDRSSVDFGADLIPTPEPTPPPTLDLTAAGMEFIQVVSGEPLVSHKATLVRVFVGVTGTTDEVSDVSGELFHGPGPGIAPLSSVDLLPGAAPMSDPAIVEDLDRTLNFLLPDSWTSPGLHDFVVHVNRYNAWRECPTCWNSENQDDAHVTFHDRDPLEVTMVEVIADTIAPTATRNATIDWLFRAYPINDVRIFPDTMSVTGYDFTDTSGSGCGTGWGALLDDLEELGEVFGSLGDEPSEMIHYGMLAEGVDHHFGGCGRRPGRASAGLVTAGRDTGGRIMAHEIGHNHGRMHALCTGTEGNPDPDYPYTGGLIGVYGVDMDNPSNPAYMDPSIYADIMSYCGDRWMSDYTYGVLYSNFAPSTVAHGLVASYQTYLVANGEIMSGYVTLNRPFYQWMYPVGTSDGSGLGDYSIELQDSAGTPLFTRYFDPFIYIDDSLRAPAAELSAAAYGRFLEKIPWQSGTDRIVIKEGSTVLHVTHVSDSPPTVSLISPNGGETWLPYGEETITWTGSDNDGDPLRYALRYSPDYGASWMAIATDLSETSYVVDVGRLAGSETALIQVLATDGVRTTYEVSEASFSVDGKPPEAYILTPSDGAVFAPGSVVILEGFSVDQEDNPLDDGSLFAWTSSLDGAVGVGRKLYVDTLRPGWHTITLTVRDRDGFTAQDTLVVFVGYRAFLPVTMK